MKQFLRNYVVNLVVILSLTCISLWYALKDHTLQIVTMLYSVQWYKILIVIVVVLFCQAIVGWILQQFAKMVKPDYSLKDGFVNALIAGFFHGITPSASGGQFVQVFVFHKQGVVVEHSISLLIMDFIVYQISMVLVSLVLLIWKMSYFVNHSIFVFGIIGFSINMMVILVLLISSFSSRMNQWIVHIVIRILARFHIVKDASVAKMNMEQKLIDFSKGLMLLRSNKVLLIKVLFANLFRLFIYYSIPSLCCWALNIHVSLDELFTMIAFTSFIMNVNACVPIPGASGSTESVFLIMFGWLLSPIDVSSVMILWRFMTYHFILVIGALLFIKVQKGDSI